MKPISIIFILIVLFTISCKDSSNKKYEEYYNMFILNINEIENKTDYIKDKIEVEMYESPIATKKWFQKSNFTTKYCDKTKTIIDSLIRVTVFNKSEYTSLSKQDISSFRKEILILQDSLISLFEYKEDIELFQKSFKRMFSILRTDKIAVFNAQKVNKQELISVLLKLWLDVSYSELSTISSIYTNVGSSHGGWYTFKPMIIPKTKTVKTGQSFEAEIYYSIFDSIIDLTYEIDGIKFKPSGGVAKYKHNVTDESGKVTKSGILTINSRRTGLDYKLPFEIKYEVLPN